jgi:subtilisin family serine protease
MRQFLFAMLVGLFVAQPALALTPNDPLFSKQWFWKTIGAPTAWEMTTGSDEVVVAVLDTGIDIAHEDLAANLFTNTREIPGNGLDDDRNGYIDDVHGYDMIDRDGDPRPETTTTMWGVHHGTVVAGLIGAVGNNRAGVTGVNWQVHLLPVRVLEANGNGDFATVVEGLRYATRMGADVINLSFVSDDTSPDLMRAVEEARAAGVVVVAALGNAAGGRNADFDPLYPACLPQVIGVTATDADDQRASFSNYGKTCADLAAPGLDMFSTQVMGSELAYAGNWRGTSLATPLVSGAVALMRALYPHATPDEVEIALKVGADPVHTSSPLALGDMGSGRLALGRALDAVRQVVKDKRGPTQSTSTLATVTSGAMPTLTLERAGQVVARIALPSTFAGRALMATPAGTLQAPLGVAWMVYAADGVGAGGEVLGYTQDGQLTWRGEGLAGAGVQRAFTALWHGVPVLWRVRLGTTTGVATDRLGVLRGVVDFGSPVRDFMVEDVNADGIADLRVRTDAGWLTYSTDGDRM